MGKSFDFAKEIFERFCRKEVEKISLKDLELLDIVDVEVFCNRVAPKFLELVNSYMNDRKKFEELSINLGKSLYRSSLSIYAIVDFAGTVIRDISISFDTVKEKFKFSLFILDLVDQISRAFIEEFLKEIEKEFSLKFAPEILENLIRKHLENLKLIVSGRANSSLKIPTAEECPLSKEFERFSFKAACSKLSICNDFFTSHERFHKAVILFSAFFREKKYFAAYLSLETAYNELYRLSRLFSVIQNYRFSFSVEDLSSFISKYLKRNFYIFSIDPSSLAFINKTLGYSVGDSILQFLENKAKNILKALGVKFDVLRSHIGAIFFIIYPSRGAEEKLNRAFSRLKVELKEAFSSLPYDLGIHGFLIEVSGPLEAEELQLSIKLALRISKKKEKLLVLNSSDESFKEELLSFKKALELVTENLNDRGVKIAIQGIHDLRSGEVSHYEVLARFFNPDTGEVIPAHKIIDLIYEYRLIDKLDLIILEKIEKNAPKFSSLGKGIFINLSPYSLEMKRSRERIVETLKNLSDKLKFGIEITEQAVIENFLTLSRVFKESNVPISLDDFGTGYSSFSRLLEVMENLNVKFLKIDGSYVKQIISSQNAEKIVSAMTKMAHSLDLKVIAEFVENGKIVKKLSEIGVDYGQGYHFSKPKLFLE